MAKKRILPGMSLMESIRIITDNSVKAQMIIIDIVIYLNENDMGVSGDYVDILSCLDNAGMYGDNICTFYSYVCKNNMMLSIALMKSCQHDGTNRINSVVLNKHLVAYGLESVNLDDIQKDVKKYLPNFNLFLCSSD